MKHDAYDRTLGWIHSKFCGAGLNSFLRDYVSEPCLSVWDFWLGIMLVALAIGPRPWWVGLPIVAGWVAVRLLAKRRGL